MEVCTVRIIGKITITSEKVNVVKQIFDRFVG